MKIWHERSQQIIAEEARYATSFRERLLGLMFIKDMKGFDALIIEPCRSIHNCFVRFALDAIFVDRDLKIVAILRNFKPWRFSRIYFSAHKVIEMKHGTLSGQVQVGDQLEVRDV